MRKSSGVRDLDSISIPFKISHVMGSTGPPWPGREEVIHRCSCLAAVWCDFGVPEHLQQDKASSERPAFHQICFWDKKGTCEIQVSLCLLVLRDDASSDTPGAALCTHFPFVIRNTFSSQNVVYQSQWLNAMWS